MSRPRIVYIAILSLWLGSVASTDAADEAKINAAIGKGQGYLSSKLKDMTGAHKSFAAYALIKTGVNKSNGDIQEAVKAAAKEATDRYAPGKPRFGHEFAYNVPCHMFLLETVDPVTYKPELESMATYLVEQQQGNGSWFYAEVPSSDACDTSQTQFALFGLWAAARAGVPVSQESVERAVTWLLRTQNSDGGFAYQPWSGSEAYKKDTYLLTTLSGAGAVLTARVILFPDTKFGDELSQMTKPKKKHGVLERMQDEQERLARAGVVNVSLAAIDKSIARAVKFVDTKFTVGSAEPFQFLFYEFYAMERMAAILDTETLGRHDWYDLTSTEIVRLQLADGSWSDKTGPVPATCLATLCLGRATSQILGKPPGKKVGGGLLAGARGLPDDLSKLQLKDGQAVERKSKGDVDDLLAELEKQQEVSIAEIQKAILEAVDLDNPDQLVGQLDRLRRLASDPRPEVRRTALWAIGRSREVRLAPLLIAGLQDVDVDVIREASYGLTVLSRKPTGLVDERGKSVPVDPTEGLEEDATDEARQKQMEQWLAHALPAWKKWYFSIRPYDERDDRQTLQKKR